MRISTTEYRGPFRLDPRTKIAYATVVGWFCLGLAGGAALSTGIVRHVLELSVAGVLAANRRWRLLAGYALIMAVAMAIETGMPAPGPTSGTGSQESVGAIADTVAGTAIDALIWSITTSAAMLIQLTPGAMTAYWLLSTTTAGELMTALERLHVPCAVTVPLAVMLRFFPTVIVEGRAIRDAMRMRGVRFGGGKASRILEFRVVPLVANSVRIADDLSQSALTRGLGSPGRRTSIARIGIRGVDVMVLTACVACLAVWTFTTAGLLP